MVKKETGWGGTKKLTPIKHITISHLTSFHIPQQKINKKTTKKPYVIHPMSCFPHLPRKKATKNLQKKQQKRRYIMYSSPCRVKVQHHNYTYLSMLRVIQQAHT